MEINKQLFEDVLSGKLKGTFALRNGGSIESNLLERSSSSSYPYTFRLRCQLYKSTGFADKLNPQNCDYDIVDFIPDIDMKEDELTIEIPNGKIPYWDDSKITIEIPGNKVVDWDESKKQNKIILKDKEATYEDVCEKLFKNKKIFYTRTNGAIDSAPYSEIEDCICQKNNAATEHQLECILAKNQLANTAKYLNDGWIPMKTSLGQFAAWTLNTYNNSNGCYIGCVKISSCSQNSNVLFKSRELALQAIEILGEETVKLALEPLGI